MRLRTGSRTAWQPEEDAALIQAVEAHGPHSWATIAAILKTRTAGQCSDRWRTQLAPGIVKDGWRAEEDETILSMGVQLRGQWSRLAVMLPGRSRHAVKNRFYALRRRVTGEPDGPQPRCTIAQAHALPSAHPLMMPTMGGVGPHQTLVSVPSSWPVIDGWAHPHMPPVAYAFPSGARAHAKPMHARAMHAPPDGLSHHPGWGALAGGMHVALRPDQQLEHHRQLLLHDAGPSCLNAHSATASGLPMLPAGGGGGAAGWMDPASMHTMPSPLASDRGPPTHYVVAGAEPLAHGGGYTGEHFAHSHSLSGDVVHQHMQRAKLHPAQDFPMGAPGEPTH